MNNKAIILRSFLILTSLILSCTSYKTFKVTPKVYTKAKRIAVLDFDNYVDYPNLDNIVRDELTRRIYSSRKYLVISRNKIKNVLEEQRFQMTGAVDPQTAVRIGKLIGADAILTGAVQRVKYEIWPGDVVMGGTLYINFQVISVETGEYLLNTTWHRKEDAGLFQRHKYQFNEKLPKMANKIINSFVHYRMIPHTKKVETKSSKILGTIGGWAFNILLIGLVIYYLSLGG